MAFNPRKIAPLDLQPRKAIGVQIPFAGEAVFTSTYFSKDALKSNLINYLLTGTGERFMNPNFGAGLRNLLFEQITEDRIIDLQDAIRDGVQQNFPTIQTSRLDLTPEPDKNTVTLFMTYFIQNTNITDELYINFSQ